LFTYVRVFGSSDSPHVLPLYVLDKLLAQEIAYQTRGEGGLNKDLKEKKKAIWPQFPVARGAFSLFDVGHAFNNVNFETGTINSKRKLWQKNPPKNIKNSAKNEKCVHWNDDFIFYGSILNMF